MQEDSLVAQEENVDALSCSAAGRRAVAAIWPHDQAL
jgi:hypothetical protein